jgi:HAD superfamily hydrolase (TIGR01509 family)
LRAVLFDWDGTLVDSAEVTYRCYVNVFARFGIAFDRSAFERTYSPEWYRTYQALGLPRERWPEADEHWLDCYRSAEAAALLPGAREALSALAGAGVALGVVSSGDRRRVAHEVEAHGLGGMFRALVCGGDTRERKPHPEPLLLALAALGRSAPEAAYVGDSPEDVGMARAAKVHSVAIPGRFPNREGLLAAGPDSVVGSLPALAQALLGRT